jgi:methionyl-tRNA formyltransferase
MKVLRILYAASPAIAVPALEALFELAGAQGPGAPIELVAVLTNPDSIQGRGKIPQPTEICLAAEQLCAQWPGLSLPLILKAEKLDPALRERVRSLKPDLLVSFAYGHIFGPKFLDMFPLGGINIHPSLLPKYRGPTPIPTAILARETETGISIQRIAAEIDSGNILIQEPVALNGRETCATLSEIMAKKAAQLLPRVLAGIASGNSRGTPQIQEQASYCSLIEKEQGCINWGKSAGDIDAHIRAYEPWPQSWTMHDEHQLFILKASVAVNVPNSGTAVNLPGQVLGIDKEQGILVQTGEGVLALAELQYSYKKALHWKNFLNGARNFIGCRLGRQTEVK